MTRDRRWWVLGPLLVLLVLVLSRGATRGPGAPPAPDDGDAIAATEPRSRGAETAAPSEAIPPEASGKLTDTAAPDDPRHPEVGFRNRERLLEHFRKHGREFKVRSPEAYLRLAQLLRDHPKDETVLQFVRNDAVTCKFDRESGAFVAYNSDGTLRTFFKPNDGEAYFERQKSRAFETP